MKVLLVDDELEMLRTFSDWLQSRAIGSERADAPAFSIDIASSPQSALRFVAERGPYAVIVSDYRMPKMDGVTFLEQVRRISPLTTRMMLTGETDLGIALDAVNRGSVFRFLTKPCTPSVLTAAVVAAIRHYQLVIAERQLLEQTLGGTVRLLTEILTFVNPAAARRAQRARRFVQHMVNKLELPNGWQLEAAAMLSHLGSITLGVDGTVNRVEASGPDALSAALDPNARLAQRLLEGIPRLEQVAAIIGCQAEPVSAIDAGRPLNERDRTRLGGQVLRVALEFDAGLAMGESRGRVLREMASRTFELEPKLVESLSDFHSGLEWVPVSMAIKDLVPGIVLDHDLYGENGLLLMKRGQEMTLSILARLKGGGSKDWLRTVLTVLVEQPPDAAPLTDPQIAVSPNLSEMNR